MIDRLDHLVLTVRDLEATCQFYERALGMQVVTFGNGRKALHFGAQKINLHVAGHEFEPKAGQPLPGSADLCLIASVPLAAVIARFASCGVDIEEGPVHRTGAAGLIRSVYVRDPDRNLIEVAEYVDTREAADPIKQEPGVHRILQVLNEREPGFMGAKQTGVFGILLPLVKMEDGKLGVLFEKRASTMRRQANEICFPGGRAEEGDESRWATARRETSEELGVPLTSIHYVGELDRLIGPGHSAIYPFVGYVEDIAKMKPNPDEVGEVFIISLERLAAAEPATYTSALVNEPEDDFPYHLIPGGKKYPWRTGTVEHLFYELDGRVIWGLTARVLAHFLELIRHEP
ncbi:NUDIX domain-containing protein [Brevibacillus parabrevis]|uniref:NUDIX domain-containing protein n=1 Tax=Brevibacillus parabrevis TaxID=54914 RepID=UPI001C210AFE|nr:NUDIX domain-containing protein [Brevibacillus parabrevis]MBU8714640.1 NUDIX domain-containing protein [Brevibacillus parabrevis]WDV94105.1 NUDIX domain-containing protein [Brevibacillus parabrevis]